MQIKVKEYEGQPVDVNTNICGSHDKPFLVLVHGYGSAGPLYFKIIKKLTQYFCVILMDMVGMGGSSRPKDYDKKTISPEASIDYFVEYMELWRIAMSEHLKIDFTQFYLTAHSFGGYMSGNYAVRYPQHIKKLLLLSPVGIKVKAEGEPELDPMKRFEGKVGPPRWVKNIGKVYWNKKISPFEPGRKLGKNLTLTMMKKYVMSR